LTAISEADHTTRFCNNLPQVCSKLKDWKAK